MGSETVDPYWIPGENSIIGKNQTTKNVNSMKFNSIQNKQFRNKKIQRTS